jgi:ribonuclease-3
MGIRLFRKTQDLPPDRKARLAVFAKKTHLPFKDLTLLHGALVHSSFAHEQKPPIPDNQRLEYLGDSVLGLIINDSLFRSYQNMDEGRMARIKASLASEQTLARAASRISLGEVLLLGRGEKQTGGKTRSSILADALEAVIGALYVDRGWQAVYTFVTELLADEIEKLSGREDVRDPKTKLQEYLQKQGKALPEYKLLGKTGPDHKSTFQISVSLSGKEIAQGTGESRKKAEHQAASNALKKFHRMRIGN